jgi:hypothetical protein
MFNGPRLWFYALFLLVLALWSGGPAWAQTVTGTISGTVVDPSGQVVPGTTVTLINERTGDARTLVTNDTGDFTFTAVRPGTYTIKVAQAGFRLFERTGNVLPANEHLAVGKLIMSLGELTETVTTSAVGSAVQVSSSEHSALLTAKQMEMISARGRDVTSLLRLLPGVSYTNDSETLGQGFGSSTPNIQGTRNTWNTLTVDGLPGNDLGSPQIFSSSINFDAISEVKVLLNNYQAESGSNAGAIVNAITKSGTRDFHGSAYWYKRHEQFNANNFFNNINNVSKPVYRYSTLGFTLGGPAYIPKFFNRNKEKLFFFYSFERWQTKNPQALRQVTTPTARERRGDFSESLDQDAQQILVRDPLLPGRCQPTPANPDPNINYQAACFPGHIIPADRFNRNGLALLNIFPLPNFLDRSITKGNYNYIFQESLDVPKRQHVLRVDYRPSDKDSIYVRGMTWFADNKGYAVPAGSSNWGLVRQHYTFTDDGVLGNYTRIINPAVVNEFSLGLRHSVEAGPPLSQQELDRVIRSKVGFLLGQFTPGINPLNIIPQASFGGVPGAAAISYDGRFPLRGADTFITINDVISMNRGSHSYKAGFYADRTRNYEGETATFAGNFNFGRDVNNPLDTGYAYANALLGNFQSYVESTSRPSAEGRGTVLEWFVQDTWKTTPKLTLDYGLRFAWYTPWRQNRGRAAAFALERFDPAKVAPLFRPVLVDGQRRAVNPVTGEIAPAVFVGALVPGVGDPVNGMVVATDKTYPAGFKIQQGVQWEPRIGFAYDLTGNGTTAIRGSFGVFHNTRPSGNFNWTASRNPPIQFNPRIFYGNIDTLLASTGVLFPSDVLAFEKNAVTPSIYNFSLGIQRDIGFATILEVAYVGSLGRHLQQSRNLNTIPYGARFLPENIDPTRPTTPTPTALPDEFMRPYPGYGSITYQENASTSSYHALQVAANRRFTRGLQFGLAYTWSKAMNYTDTDGGGVALYRPVRVWNYGAAGFDQTHVLVINYTWDLPSASRLWNHAVAHYLFDNWQVSGIAAFVSGTPAGVGFSTTDTTDITGGGDGARVVVTGRATLPRSQRNVNRWFDPTVFARPAKGDFGNAPRNIFRQPGVNNWDVSFFKNIRVKSETRALQLRWEIYNVFNHTQFSGVDNGARFNINGDQVNRRFGAVTSARSPRVMQASLRFTF